MLAAALCVLFALVLYHAWLEWRDGLADYLCQLVRIEKCPRWLAPTLTVLAIGNLAIPLAGALFSDGWRQILLAYAAGGFVGDTLSTHVIPSLLTKRRAPALSTWWAYLLASIGLALYLDSFLPLPFTLGITSFVALWPAMLLLRAALRKNMGPPVWQSHHP